MGKVEDGSPQETKRPKKNTAETDTSKAVKASEWNNWFFKKEKRRMPCVCDIYECLMNPCHVNARCTDSEGSFVCQCDVGFSGDGISCSSKCFNTSFEAPRKAEERRMPCVGDNDEYLTNPCHVNARSTDSLSM
ncbi:nidogen-2 isoform X2 [Paramuricea clavata]|uniref:Nidogen-2 isoform X2 n=1 Tax=Paramuricea clavata TaxID=317549 RepID=A0A7D9EQ14_PARCT|nr:nidogen-2 isoform X2 [Paramuricea clavata]